MDAAKIAAGQSATVPSRRFISDSVFKSEWTLLASSMRRRPKFSGQSIISLSLDVVI